MKRCALVLLILIAAASAQSTPEEAIVKFVTAETQQDVISVLPEKTRTALAKASPKTRAELFSKFMELKKEEGLKVDTRLSDDLLTISDKDGSTVHLKVKQTVNDGMTAVVVLNITIERKNGTREAFMPRGAPSAIVWTRMEEGNWRIAGIGGGAMFELDGDQVLAAIKNDLQPPPEASEASAVGSLRTLNTANVTYASTYDLGFAPSIQALGGEGKEPTPEHALLIDPVLASGDKNGYVFRYERSGQDTYTITARPKPGSVSGKRSFFTDESGVIRFTEEDRSATAQDLPVQ
jgi:hypothetical protein